MSNPIENLQQLATTRLGMTAKNIKPLVMLPGNGVQIRDTASEIYQLASAAKGLFFSSAMVMKITQKDEESLPRLSPLIPASAMSEFEKFARFGKIVGQKQKEDIMSEGIAKAILQCDVAKDALPHVKGLLNRPMPMLENGRIEILKAGYNATSGYIVAGGSIIESESLEDAVGIIKQTFADLDFQTEADTSRAIACILTPAMKIGGFIKGNTPISIVEALESQTGKGLFLHLRQLIYAEKPILISKSKGGVGSLDEQFQSALVSGRPFIQYDNVRGELNSQILEAFSTNPATLLIRTPFSAAQEVDGSNRFISISSNGMVTTEDLANRASFIRLIKDPDRTFTMIGGMGIDEVIVAHQGRFMGAIVKVIRHWFDQGMPKTDEKRHDFREWAQKLDWIVQNVFELPPLMDGQEQVKQRAQNPALSFIRLVAIQIEKAGRLGVELSAQDVADICEASGTEIPGLNKKGGEGYAEIQSAQRIGQLFGQAFKLENIVAVDQFRITRTERLRTVFGSGNTYSGKLYIFDHIAEETAVDREADSTFNEPPGD